VTETTLRVAATVNAQVWSVVDATAARIGDLAVCGAERARVIGLLPTALLVARGISGTLATPHAIGSVVQYGPNTEFSALFGVPPPTWVDATGTSPQRTAKVQIQDDANTITIVTITY
jgi:hypothetical protein